MKETVDRHFSNYKEKLKKTADQNKYADSVTHFLGSWTFVYIVVFFLVFWTSINIIALENAWDPYPFFVLSFIINCLTLLQVPVILMSQNRQDHRQMLRIEYDYAINKKSEKEIEEIKAELDEIKAVLKRK